MQGRRLKAGVGFKPPEAKMRTSLAAAAIVLRLCVPAEAQESWDLARCQQSLSEVKAKAGHVCTPEHLEADLAQLSQKDWGATGNHVVPSRKVLRAWAEIAILETTTAAQPAVTSAPEPTPSNSGPTIRWAAGAPHSREFLNQGRRVRIIDAGSLHVLALIESSDADPLRIGMSFLNQTERAFDVIPEHFTLAVVEPREKAGLLPYMSPQQVAKRIEKAAMWAMVAEGLASVGRAMGGTSTTTTSGTVTAQGPYGGTAYGTYNGLTTTYDSTANQQLTAANIATISTASEAQKLRQTMGALLPNTVFSGNSYAGIIHFKREKHARLLLLRAPVAGQVFEFPLEMPSK